MYDLTTDLRYDTPLRLEDKYRYDFVGFDLMPIEGHGLLCGSIFVFRTIKTGNGSGNVLIDLIDYSNVNAFDTVLHGDCNFHMLDSNKLLNKKEYRINDNTILNIVDNSLTREFYITLSNQKYKKKFKLSSEDSEYMGLSEYKYLLFTQYLNNPVNMKYVQLAPIFDLQEQIVWDNERYSSFKELHASLNDNIIENYGLGYSTPWEEVGETIDIESKERKLKLEKKHEQIVDLRCEQDYYPIEE